MEGKLKVLKHQWWNVSVSHDSLYKMCTMGLFLPAHFLLWHFEMSQQEIKRTGKKKKIGPVMKQWWKDRVVACTMMQRWRACVCVYLLTGGVRTGHSGVRSGGEKGSMTGSRSWRGRHEERDGHEGKDTLRRAERWEDTRWTRHCHEGTLSLLVNGVHVGAQPAF